jgi:hypothetical protein
MNGNASPAMPNPMMIQPLTVNPTFFMALVPTLRPSFDAIDWPKKM